jgi:hypothetical protein
MTEPFHARTNKYMSPPLMGKSLKCLLPLLPACLDVWAPMTQVIKLIRFDKMNTRPGRWSVMIAKQQRKVVPCLLLRF